MQTYNLSNKIKFGINNKNDKYNLYRQFVTWSCNGCYVAPLTDYANNEIYQELPKQNDYFTNSGKRLYLDLRRSKRYTGELEKLTRADSNVILKIALNASTIKK